MITKNVYELLPLLDAPGHRGLGIVEENPPSVTGKKSFRDDFKPDSFRRRDWQVPRLASIWRPIKIRNSRPNQNLDYGALAFIIPTFSQRSVDVMRDLLEPNGELLPTICDNGTFFIYNPTTIVDALNRQASEVDWFDWMRDDRGEMVMAAKIYYYDFIPERLADLAIFRIRERPHGFFVTDVFADRVRSHKLNGFNLQKVWPLPRPPEGVKAAVLRRGRELIEKNESPKEHTVVIRLKIDDHGGESADIQHQRIERMMNELDDLLIDDSFQNTMIADLKGHEYVDGECRLFLSGDNADKIVDVLRPWLRELDWPSGFSVLKRYGFMYDKNAPECSVEEWE